MSLILGSNPERIRKVVLLILALGISVLFLWMIREFLGTLLFAAILSGLFKPLFLWVCARVGGRATLASGITVTLVFLLFIIPALGFFGMVAAQAIELAQELRPMIEEQFSKSSSFNEWLARTPWVEHLGPYRDQIVEKLGQIAGHAGNWAVNALATAARETVSIVIALFVLLYALFFFFIDGREILQKILFYLPLPPEDENRMLERFVSVSRATIKGSLMIGAIQGMLGGLAFWVAGIQGAALWGTVMAVLSFIPGIGATIVWIPACAYLALVGRFGAALGVFAWCAGIVGTIDNLLRPRLVGKDSKMPDLLILLATLGGIVLFGAGGIVIGPIVAALFVTIWELYGAAFSDVLPRVEALPGLDIPSQKEAEDEPPSR